MNSHPDLLLWIGNTSAQPRNGLVIGRFAGVLLYAAVAWCQAAPVQYQVQDIGGLRGASVIYGSDINNLGEITATAYTTEGSHVVVYQGRRLHDLVLLPGFTDAYATTINDQTEIVGTQYTRGSLPDGLVRRFDVTGFLYTGGELIDLETLIGVEGWTLPVDINNHGAIVGNWFRTNLFNSVGFTFANGTFTLLPQLAPDRTIHPTSINDHGDIAATARTANVLDGARAVLIQNGHLQDLGLLPDTMSSAANGLNNHGTVVGICHNSGIGHRGFVYRRGVMTDVGTLPGFESTFLSRVNNHEQIVGGCIRNTVPWPIILIESRAIVISAGVMHDLNDLVPSRSGRLLTDASAINDKGEIMAHGKYRGSDQQRTFLLTPIGQAR